MRQRTSRFQPLAAPLFAAVVACDSGTPTATSPQPSGLAPPGAARTSGPTPPNPGPDPNTNTDAKTNPDAVRADTEYPLPTAEEKAETPLEAYVPIVPAPGLDSVLPCPPGTTQNTGENVIECRIGGKVGESLSKRQGPSVWFYPNGKVQRAGSYENHEWTGRWWSFDEQGRLESSIAYIAGKEEGLGVTFYPNGKRRSESFYKAGKLDGPSKSWTEDGELMGITVNKDDKAISSKVFRYTLKEATPQEAENAREELRRLLAEQKKLTEAK
jgi:hypothetical protein